MNVLLVQPNHGRIIQKTSHPHSGIAYLGARSIEKGFTTRAIDAKYEGIGNEEVIRRAVEIAPDVLGVTARTPDIEEADRIARALKEARPSARTVVGGAHVTGVGERVLQEEEGFDIAVEGEGEDTFSELLDLWSGGRGSLGGIRGIIYRENGDLIRTEPRPFLQDLDSLPFPAWQIFHRVGDVPLFTSRGCPYRCIFCQRIMGNKVRTMSPERVIREMRWAVDRFGARFFQIEDEVFGTNRKWVDRLLDRIIEEGLHKNVKWIANSRVNVANSDLYRKMKAAGCVRLGFGIESGNQEILNGVGKGFLLEEAKEAIHKAHRAGLLTDAFFILGHPNETRKTIRDSIDFAVKLNPTDVSFGMMIPYPGTRIYEMAKAGEGGYRSFHEDWASYTKYFGKGLELDGLDHKTLRRYQKQAYVEFYLRNLRFRDLFGFVKKFLRITGRSS